MCIAVLTTVPVLIQSRRRKNLQPEITDIRPTLRAQGFKTELADFNGSTDAATRARVAAWFTFENAPRLNSAGDELDLLPAVSNDTAAVNWKRASLKAGANRID